MRTDSIVKRGKKNAILDEWTRSQNGEWAEDGKESFVLSLAFQLLMGSSIVPLECHIWRFYHSFFTKREYEETATEEEERYSVALARWLALALARSRSTASRGGRGQRAARGGRGTD